MMMMTMDYFFLTRIDSFLQKLRGQHNDNHYTTGATLNYTEVLMFKTGSGMGMAVF